MSLKSNDHTYNKRPKLVGNFDLQVGEYFSYLYMPIKLPRGSLVYEPRLKVFDQLIKSARSDFISTYSNERYHESYLYITARSEYQYSQPFNRPGWHSDGFLTDDINYIWSNAQPTIFNSSEFNLTLDDHVSMVEMEEQAIEENNYTFDNNSLLRLDQFSIHKVGDFIRGDRCFFKLSISYDKYDLLGNSINYLLDYKFDYRKRNQERNVPQKL